MSTLSPAHLDNSSDNFSMHSDEDTPVFTCADPSSSYRKYFNCKKPSDVIIKYGSKGANTFHGHRILLATQSKYFDELFTQMPMDVKETTLERDGPEMVEVILKLAYGHQPQSPTLEGTLENVIFAIQLFQISAKYDFSEFEELAVTGFTVCLSRFIHKTAKGQGPTFVELTTIVKSVYGIAKAGRLVESLIQIITTNPHVCAFRTWDSLSLLILGVAQQEPRFEGSLCEELWKVRLSEHEALDASVAEMSGTS
ncbi:BTB-POZ domain protein [Pyrenophora teres f. teres]|uniref:BTB-POZ domain protein n=1 Tax=Pyrenophora teres f. teres TaxID=97479 RepID=A0A6S6VFN3_9PLEO|nr:BTB-POZ domain protein [Pyrenophora teres f. teres]